ncbi:MAG: radical SAM protein [Acidobacteria bacterium]|nr:radical SAM protein [Acidobacteriota bacterium]
MPSVLLINPPVAKPCEPPAGLVRLAGFLASSGVPVTVWDAGLEGVLHALATAPAGSDTWTRRAARSRERHLALLRSPDGCRNRARYARAVADLEHLAGRAGEGSGFTPGLADCTHAELSPARSRDLIRVAENPGLFPLAPFLRRRLSELLDTHSPELAGVSLTYRNQAFGAFALLGLLSRECPRLPVLVGGGLVTSWSARQPLDRLFAGLAERFVAGPGEPALASRLGLTPGHGPGVSDPSGFPMDRYLAPGTVVPYGPSSGCWWGRCRFCPETAEGNHHHALPARKVVADLQALATRWRPSLFHLADNALSPALLEALATDPPGAPWYGFARFTEALAEPGFAAALAESGCVMLQLGLESGDPGVLEAMGKGIGLETASRVLRTLHGAGIATYVYLLFGTPWESLAEARRTLDFTAAHAGTVGFLNLALFNLPLGSPDTAALGLRPFSEGDLSLYADFDHPRGFGRAAVRRFLDREFRAHPAVRPILARTPPVFTSNHAPFFAMADAKAQGRA